MKTKLVLTALTLTLGAGIASAGPLDRLEDRVDRIESVLDRNGIERTPRIDRVERRSIRWRFWNTANTE